MGSAAEGQEMAGLCFAFYFFLLFYEAQNCDCCMKLTNTL